MQKVTLGGDRIGSGSGNDVYMHDYEMSSHNLSQRFTSTMGCGTLIPCLCIPATRGDYFDVDIKAQARTIPTRGPLFSTFKMQVDLYYTPWRLYQALLHNNAIRLGMNMRNVKLPKLQVITSASSSNKWKNGAFANNSLLKYLRMSGIGRAGSAPGLSEYGRNILAIPALTYYDIFKNYYANKQENNAYIINTQKTTEDRFIISEVLKDSTVLPIGNITGTPNEFNKFNGYKTVTFAYDTTTDTNFTLSGNFSDNISYEYLYKNLYLLITFKDEDLFNDTIRFYLTAEEAIDQGWFGDFNYDGNDITFTLESGQYPEGVEVVAALCWKSEQGKETDKIALQSFDLGNIDEMRLDLLSYHTLGSPFVIGTSAQTGSKPVYLPYSALTARQTNGITANAKPLNGIAIKTYQSDLFNNWLNTAWVEGENSIAEMSKVAVSDGAIYMDALLFAKKTYNLLNRVAASGGTYQDWLDAVYTSSPRRHIETPMFVGGLSTEIVFEEIIQNAPTEGHALGTLGGRGVLVNREGGHAYIECDEPAFIMGIVSITPRLYYTQGNAFYMTDIDSVDDLHKPEYDGIGFQNLIGERMCWTDTVIAPNGTTVLSRTIVGKVPAWIEYMTAVDEAFGEFVDVDKQGFMVLNRNYEIDESTGAVKDFTTYIDPAKYNYAFGESTLLSQNFWVQIQFDIKARRKMSAREIPNL